MKYKIIVLPIIAILSANIATAESRFFSNPHNGWEIETARPYTKESKSLKRIMTILDKKRYAHTNSHDRDISVKDQYKYGYFRSYPIPVKPMLTKQTLRGYFNR